MIKNQKILIFGFAEEGVSSANFLGQDNQITILDQKPRDQIDSTFFGKLKIINVNFCFGGNLPSQKFDLLVRAPGIKPDHPIVKKFTEEGSLSTSQTKIFFDLCPCPIIGVTGTKGKGTTSTLIYEMLKTQLSSVYLGGNIGTPPLDFLGKLTKKSLAVLELSSFQLIDLKKSPHIAVVLMITSEHLDWHQDSQEYHDAKEPIVRYQKHTDFAVINQDFAVSKSFAAKIKAKVVFVSTLQEADVSVDGDMIVSNINSRETIVKTSQILLPGPHNLQNVVAATAAAKIIGVASQNIAQVLSTFKGLPHRLELVREVDGVKFYNDSFSTTPETTIAAIKSFANPKILVLGGSSKNSDFDDLAKTILADSSIKAIILIGREGSRIEQVIKQSGQFTGKIVKGLKNMREIITKSRSLAQRGDIILLSPACASFDMFKNYKDRGEQFRNQVLTLK